MLAAGLPTGAGAQSAVVFRTPGPNLRPMGMTVQMTSCSGCDAFFYVRVQITVKNTGLMIAPASMTRVLVKQSFNGAWTVGDAMVQTPPLAPGQSFTGPTQWFPTLPVVSVGALVSVDYYQQIAESIETDNMEAYGDGF